MPRYMRPYFAWYGDMELASHLWDVLRLAPVTAVVEFHPTATIDRFASRKALASHCHTMTSAGLSAALHGLRLRNQGRIHGSQAA
jgi:lyso-ornithine lipid O-acyltransferase